jgi:hypothetical protein
MDDLIKSVKQFSIKNDASEFENNLDTICSKMQDLETNQNYVEWEILKSNYSKLRYLDYLIEGKSIFSIKKTDLPAKFYESLDAFLEKMDHEIKHYFECIDFELDEYEPKLLRKTKKIKKLFEESLNCNESIKKMKLILEAFNILIPIAEGLTKEKFKDQIEDREFLKTFTFKRQKIN